jgi:uncharacterized protein Veg
MRKINETLNEIKAQIELLKGQHVNMQVNRGRRKIEHYDAVVETIYPSVFTVKINSPQNETMSYSYSEVLCGDVKISAKNF